MTVVRQGARTLAHEPLPPLRRESYRMAMPATHTEWTVEMLDALEDDGQRYELIDGSHCRPSSKTR